MFMRAFGLFLLVASAIFSAYLVGKMEPPCLPDREKQIAEAAG